MVDRGTGTRQGDGSLCADGRRLPWKGLRFGRLIITTCRQGGRAPFIDHAWTTDQDGNRYTSKAILLTPWRKTSYGERPPMQAFVIGWRVG